MAFVVADRVKETTTTTGTGTITLAGAYTGYQSFLAGVGNGNSTYYCIADQGGSNWEVGIGTYTSSTNTLSRTTVLASSNAGSLVNFGSGTKDVFITLPASKIQDPGEVSYFAMNTAPTGWLKANGAAVSRTTYAALFAAIGTTFGTGDGSTTFNLPDLRGEFFRGWDDSRGVDSGRVFGSSQSDAIRNITGHFGNGFYGEYGQTAVSGAFVLNGSAGYTKYTSTGWSYNGPSVDFSASNAVPTAGENRPRSIALLACISY
jgi:microcystin-dependent protein